MNHKDHYLNEKKLLDFATLIPKTYSFLTDGTNKNKKPNGTKNFVTKPIIKVKDYKNSFEATQIENKINQLEKKNKFFVIVSKRTITIHKKQVVNIKVPTKIYKSGT